MRLILQVTWCFAILNTIPTSRSTILKGQATKKVVNVLQRRIQPTGGMRLFTSIPSAPRMRALPAPTRLSLLQGPKQVSDSRLPHLKSEVGAVGHSGKGPPIFPTIRPWVARNGPTSTRRSPTTSRSIDYGKIFNEALENNAEEGFKKLLSTTSRPAESKSQQPVKNKALRINTKQSSGLLKRIDQIKAPSNPPEGANRRGLPANPKRKRNQRMGTGRRPGRPIYENSNRPGRQNTGKVEGRWLGNSRPAPYSNPRNVRQ